eukprot:11200758-Lingulodinium_polyedra.AAC.1
MRSAATWASGPRRGTQGGAAPQRSNPVRNGENSKTCLRRRYRARQQTANATANHIKPARAR